MEISSFLPWRFFHNLRVEYVVEAVHSWLFRVFLFFEIQNSMLSCLKAVVPIGTVPRSLGYEHILWAHVTIVKPGNRFQIVGDIIRILHLQRSSKSFSCEGWSLLNDIQFSSVDIRKLLRVSLSSLVKPRVVRRFKSMHGVHRVRRLTLVRHVLHYIPELMMECGPHQVEEGLN